MSTAQFTVADTNPISIYPAGLQGPVTIFNTGTNDVYVSETNSTVYQIPIKAGNSIQWNAGTSLYAYVLDTTKPTSLIVVNTAVASPPANVSAVVSGSVDVTKIGQPVNVQGGGEALYLGTVNIGAYASASVNIPAPASGLTYFGLMVELRWTTPAGTDLALDYYIRDAANNTLVTGGLGYAAHMIGNPGNTRFTCATTSNFPLTLSLSAVNPNASSVYVSVYGVSTAPVFPTTDLSYVFGGGSLNNGVGIANGINNYYLPGVFQPYYLDLFLPDNTNTIAAANYSQQKSATNYIVATAINFSPDRVGAAPVGYGTVGPARTRYQLMGNGLVNVVAFNVTGTAITSSIYPK